MKTKIWWIVAVAIVLTAAVLVTVFLVLTKDKTPDQPEGLKAEDLAGDWIVTRSSEKYDGAQLWHFEATSASCFVKGSDQAKVTSAFTIGDKVTTPSGNLDTVVFSDINRTFAYEALTDECIKLTDTATKTTMTLIKADFNAMGKLDVDGSWRVVLHSNTKVVGETMSFADGQLHFADATRTVDSAYTITDSGVLTAEKLGLSIDLYKLSDTRIALVQQTDGYVWILEKTTAAE